MKCSDCGSEMRILFTDRTGKRVWECRKCYDSLELKPLFEDPFTRRCYHMELDDDPNFGKRRMPLWMWGIIDKALWPWS